jgi:hypothetical protein
MTIPLIFYRFYLFHLEDVKQDNYMTIFCVFSFVTPTLQNPLLHNGGFCKKKRRGHENHQNISTKEDHFLHVLPVQGIQK